MVRREPGVVAALAGLIFVLLLAMPAWAAAYVVTTTADNTLSDGDCTLREAILAANDDPAYNGDCGPASLGDDTITFAVSGTILLSSRLPVIADAASAGALTIDGSGQSIVVSGNNSVPIFAVPASANLTIQSLTVSNGIGDNVGGGLNNRGTATIINSTFSGNSVPYSISDGGGIYNLGTVNILNSTFSGNSASGLGGGVFNAGTANIVNSTFFGNTAGASGGGIFNGVRGRGTMNIRNSIIADNLGGNCDNWNIFNVSGVNFDTDGTCPGFTQVGSADLSLGPLADNGGPTPTQGLLPGSIAIDAVIDCTDLSGNPVTTDQRGVTRPQEAACDAGSYETQLFPSAAYVVTTTADDILGDGDCTLREAILAANDDPAYNGDCGPASLGDDTITFAVTGTIALDPSLGPLPDIRSRSGWGALTIDGRGRSIAVSGNNSVRVFAVKTGGDLALQSLTVSDGNADLGGGIFNDTYGIVTLSNSTLFENAATGNGGGLYNLGTANIHSSTLSGNSAGNFGGGIFNIGTANIDSSTFFGNNAGASGGGISNGARGLGFGTVNIRSSIVAESPSVSNCYAPASKFTASGVNFDTDGTCPGFTQVGAADLNLGPLADNGGPTPTHALLAGSVAIDAVTDCTDLSGNPVTADQRGAARPEPGGTACDVGAFEFGSPAPETNQPPVADVTLSPTLAECTSLDGAQVTLDGTASSDPDGDLLTFQWSAPGIVFDDPTSPTPTATFPLGTTTVTLVVNDGTVDSDPVTVDVAVQDTTAPEITAAWVLVSGDDDDDDSEDDEDHRFRLEFSATDACDPSPQVTGVLQTPSLDGLQVKLKTKKRVKVEFDLKKNEVEIEGPDPAAILTQLQDQGGLEVSNNQLVQVDLIKDNDGRPKVKFKFEKNGLLRIKATSAVLRVTAEDASGNVATQEVSPNLPADDDDDEDGLTTPKGSVTTLQVSRVLSLPYLFVVQGRGIESVQVQIFSLSGQRVFGSKEQRGRVLRWNLRNDWGEQLANGVYLYVITVKGYDGTIHREVRKLVILR